MRQLLKTWQLFAILKWLLDPFVRGFLIEHEIDSHTRIRAKMYEILHDSTLSGLWIAARTHQDITESAIEPGQTCIEIVAEKQLRKTLNSLPCFIGFIDDPVSN